MEFGAGSVTPPPTHLDLCRVTRQRLHIVRRGLEASTDQNAIALLRVNSSQPP